MFNKEKHTRPTVDRLKRDLAIYISRVRSIELGIGYIDSAHHFRIDEPGQEENMLYKLNTNSPEYREYLEQINRLESRLGLS